MVVIATGYNSCDYVYDSSLATNRGSGNGKMPALCSNLLQKLEEFMIRDEQLCKKGAEGGLGSSLLSGSLSMALCCILVFFVSVLSLIFSFYYLFEFGAFGFVIELPRLLSFYGRVWPRVEFDL